jgi:hypothetical protein
MGLAADTDLITFGSGTLTIAGTVAATTLTGAGAGITALAAANITASGTLPALVGTALTALNATNLGSGTVPVARLSAASTTAAGIAELAINTEVNTGTSATLAVTPDALAGSVYGEKNIQMIVFDWATALTTGSKFYFYVPATLNGFVVVDAHAAMITAPQGADVNIQIQKAGVDDIFTVANPLVITANTIVSIDPPASGAWELNSSFSTLTTGTILRVDVDQVGSSTAGSGLYINLTCRRP